MIGRAQITRRGVGRAALAVAVAAVAASVVYFGGRALGLGDDAPAAGQGEPPVLKIFLPSYCEGGQAAPFSGSVWRYDDDGERVRTGTSVPFYFLGGLGSTTLRWEIEGGTAPYELSVQGHELLARPAGETRVYCADSLPVDELDFTAERGELEWQKTYSPALVSPGPLTIKATVTDANGLAARATATTYVILNCEGIARRCDFDVYPSGFTYRIDGLLFTIPQGLNINARRLGGLFPDCADDADDAGPPCQVRTVLYTVGDPHQASLLIGRETREYLGYYSTLSPKFQWARPDYAAAAGAVSGADDAPPHPDADKFKQFGQSLGQWPSLNDN